MRVGGETIVGIVNAIMHMDGEGGGEGGGQNKPGLQDTLADTRVLFL